MISGRPADKGNPRRRIPQKYVSSEKPDAVIVEYPFNEFNPIILIDFNNLHRECKKSNAKLVLSMHEYDRVKFLRKKVIESFLKNSDLVFVSEPHYLMTLKPFNSNIYLRTIPNHIVSRQKVMNKDSKRFAYFGMINKAKAFDEMIEAWKNFNISGEYSLEVVTVSEVQIKDVEKYGIHCHIGETDNRVAEILSEVAFSVLPIKPFIAYNNSSMVSCAQCGCIVIGKASDIVSKEGFVVEPDDYSPESIEKALKKAVCLDPACIEAMRTRAVSFGSYFTIESTVSQMLERLIDE